MLRESIGHCVFKFVAIEQELSEKFENVRRRAGGYCSRAGLLQKEKERRLYPEAYDASRGVF
jgi:hypothetical protein